MSVPAFPLYRGLEAPLAPSPGAMHMGLWFERFFHGYENDFAAVNTQGRGAWLRQFDLKQVGARSELQAKAEKIRRALNKLGYRMTKSRSAIGIDNLGEFIVCDLYSNVVVANSSRYDMTLDDIEHEFLS